MGIIKRYKYWKSISIHFKHLNSCTCPRVVKFFNYSVLMDYFKVLRSIINDEQFNPNKHSVIYYTISPKKVRKKAIRILKWKYILGFYRKVF